jgi:PAS domain S-box-containing protein
MNTVNSELKDKIEESARTNSDLQNLIASTDIATIFLDRKLRIKRFSPLVEQLFNITPTDIGRPLEHFTHRLEYSKLTADAAEVLKTLKTIEREISDKDNRYFLTRFSPYRTVDDRIEGVVLNFLEITKYRHAEEALREAQEKYRVRLEQEVEERTAELRKSREQFASVVENTPDLITRWDKNLKLVYANGAFEAAMGVPNASLYGKTSREMGEPEEIAGPYMKSLREAFETGAAVEHFNTFSGPEGSAYFYSRIVPEKNERGETETVLATARDITALKNAEREIIQVKEELAQRAKEELRDSEQRFRAIVTTGSDAVYSMNADWTEMRFLVGKDFIPDTEDPNTTWLEKYIHPDDRPTVLRKINEAIATKSVFELEHRVLTVDGTLGWTHSRAIPLFDDAGEINGWCGTAQDITAKRVSEAALRESQSRLQLLMESVQDYAIMTTDLKGIVTEWNKGAENIFGWTAEEIIGKSSDLIFTPEDLAKNVPEKERQTAREKGRAEDERIHLRKDGTRFYVSGMLTPLANGEIEGYVKIARDKTEKMRAEKDKQEKEILSRLVGAQEDERKRIARDLHDELGQQLTALRLKLQAARKISDDEIMSGRLDEMQLIARQIDDGVDFLAWELRPSALDDLGLYVALDKYVSEWSHYSGVRADLLAPSFKKTRFLPEVEMNLYRIVQEALNNVYKHAEAKSVDVILEKREDLMVLIIADDGKGFDPEDKNNRRKGMGLTGMRERAALIGGTLEFESTPDEGTSIYVRVPIALATEAKNQSS